MPRKTNPHKRNTWENQLALPRGPTEVLCLLFLVNRTSTAHHARACMVPGFWGTPASIRFMSCLLGVSIQLKGKTNPCGVFLTNASWTQDELPQAESNCHPNSVESRGKISVLPSLPAKGSAFLTAPLETRGALDLLLPMQRENNPAGVSKMQSPC